MTSLFSLAKDRLWPWRPRVERGSHADQERFLERWNPDPSLPPRRISVQSSEATCWRIKVKVAITEKAKGREQNSNIAFGHLWEETVDANFEEINFKILSKKIFNEVQTVTLWLSTYASESVLKTKKEFLSCWLAILQVVNSWCSWCKIES